MFSRIFLGITDFDRAMAFHRPLVDAAGR